MAFSRSDRPRHADTIMPRGNETLAERALQQSDRPADTVANPDQDLQRTSRPFYDRVAFRILLGLLTYGVIRTLARATIKHLWFDELLTQVMARQHGITALWRALKTASDGAPPPFYVPFYLMDRLAAAIPINEHIAYRLPSIVAFSLTLLCLYRFVEWRSGPAAGLLCAGLVFLTPFFVFYADEARPYAMLLACIAFALVCYQRLPSIPRTRGAWSSSWSLSPWTIGLFASLFLAMCLHYYGILSLTPFFAAELFLTGQTKRPRFFVWAALLLATVPLVIFWPLLSTIKAYYGVNLWSKPEFTDALGSYADFFHVDPQWGFALAGLLVAAVLLALFRSAQAAEPAERIESREQPPPHEHVLVLGFLLYPLIVFVFAKVMHAGSAPRYFLCGILGVALAFRYVLDWLPPRLLLACAGFLLLSFALQEFTFWSSFRTSPAPAEAANSLQALADSVHREDLPLVMADSLAYFETLHYASPALRQRMIALVDPQYANLYVGTDSLDKNMLALRPVTPVNVQGFVEFTEAHRSFLLYSEGTAFEWLPSILVADGESVSLLTEQGDGMLYLVALKPEGN